MKKILIIYNGNINNAPRPRRMIECLEKEYELFVYSKKSSIPDELKSINFIFHNNSISKVEKIYKILLNKSNLYNKSIHDRKFTEKKEKLKKYEFDYIICHNIQLLPLALEIKKNAKLIFDAREYFPKHFEDRMIWKMLYQDYNNFLVKTYMPKSDFIITVSDGIKKQYKKDLNVKNIEVIESFPDYWDLKPSQIEENKIKIIHHGNATKSRKLEEMIYMMDFVDNKYRLDLMLVPSDKKYYNFLKNLVEKRENVNLIEPVAYKQIIPFINKYDIGLFIANPTTFNLKYTLPNKFFEFIQARLAVIIGPSIEMKKYIDKYKFGKYSNSFDYKELAQLLNNLSEEEIFSMKLKANEVSKLLNKNKTCIKFKNLLRDIK